LKKIILLLVGLIVITTFIGCSKQSKEPYLTLGYNGFTNTTVLINYQDNNTKHNYEAQLGNNYLKVSQNSQVDYYSSKDIDSCTLLIQNAETKEKVEEIVLDSNIVKTNIPQGKYIYTFSTKWKNGSSKFIELIEIQ